MKSVKTKKASRLQTICCLQSGRLCPEFFKPCGLPSNYRVALEVAIIKRWQPPLATTVQLGISKCRARNVVVFKLLIVNLFYW